MNVFQYQDFDIHADCHCTSKPEYYFMIICGVFSNESTTSPDVWSSVTLALRNLNSILLRWQCLQPATSLLKSPNQLRRKLKVTPMAPLKAKSDGATE
jgi:hypothetical protein